MAKTYHWLPVMLAVDRNGRINMQRLMHLGYFLAEDILPLIKTNTTKEIETFEVRGYKFSVKLTGHRLRTFRDNPRCIHCGREGVLFILEQFTDQSRAHFNMYAVDPDGKLVLMTKDHIIPVSKGGRNTPENFQTMCEPCNNKKADSMPDGVVTTG